MLDRSYALGATHYVTRPLYRRGALISLTSWSLELTDEAGLDAARLELLRRVHDAFSIMACLLMEAVGFAERGEGWRLAADKRIFPNGDIPVATMGGLKARGHPIGATAIYQTCEIVLQLTDRAGKNQVPNPQIGLLQSVGGAASTVLTHVFGT